MENNTEQVIQVIRPKKFIAVKKAVWIAAILIIAALLYYFRSAFIAATVNGSLISRMAVVGELEKQSGAAALDSLITLKLIESEASKKNIKPGEEEINARLKDIEAQVTASGGQTLDEALKAEGITLEGLKEQIAAQLKLEKLLVDKISVTDEEVAKYIADNKTPTTKGQEAEQWGQIKQGLRQQKLQTEAAALLQNLRAAASIKYFVEYK